MIISRRGVCGGFFKEPMLSEKRVIQMTRMAIDEKENARFYGSVANISKRDYIGAKGTVAFIVGTITYGVIFLAIMAALFNTVIGNIDQVTIMLIGVLGLLGYLFYLFFYMAISRRRAARRYDRGKAALDRRIGDIKRLEDIYIEEEENRSPTISMEALDEALPMEALSAELPDERNSQESL